MLEKSIITEGIVSQLKKTIYDNIPHALKEACKKTKTIDVEKEISDIVEKYLVKKISLKEDNYEISQSPKQEDIKAVIKRRNYHRAKLIKELHDEYNRALEGSPVLERRSPYNDSAVVVAQLTAQKSRAEAIEVLSQVVNGYLDRLEGVPAVKAGVGGFVGFYEYPYFTLILENECPRAIKMLKVDLEEYVFRLSVSPEYKNYAYYTAESVGKGFYAESSRAKKDAEYELESSEYLRNTFFPDELNVCNVSISARKTWDDRDMSLFSYLCTKCVTESLGSSEVLSVEGNLFEICKILYPNVTAYSVKHYSIAEKRLTNLAGTQLIAQSDDGKEIIRNIIDQAIVDHRDTARNDGSKGNGAFFRIEFGRNISADILFHRLSTVIKSRLDELENPVSKFLYIQLKKDRALDLYLSARKSTHEYSLIGLMLIFKVREAKKAEKIKRYTEALEEMKAKKLLIQDFKVIDAKFMINWIPLSEAEEKDIRVLKQPAAEDENVIGTINQGVFCLD